MAVLLLRVVQALPVAVRRVVPEPQPALVVRLWQAPAAQPQDLWALEQPDSCLLQAGLVPGVEIAQAKSVRTRMCIDRWQVVFS